MEIDRVKKLLTVTPELKFRGSGGPTHSDWTRAVKGTVRQMLGCPTIAPWKVLSATPQAIHGLHTNRYRFAGSHGLTVEAVLLRPSAEGTHPAVLVLPSLNADIEKITGFSPKEYADQNIAEQLAQQGLATLTVKYSLKGALRGALVAQRNELDMLSLAVSLVGDSILALLVRDGLQCLAWLEQQAWAQKVAIFGRSLGGAIAAHLGLAYPRDLVVALSSCMGTYFSMFMEQMSGSGATALPGILKHVDFPDLVAALAPRPLHLQHGRNDPVYPIDQAEGAIRTVEESYAVTDASERLDVQYTAKGHGTDTTLLVEFLKRHCLG